MSARHTSAVTEVVVQERTLEHALILNGRNVSTVAIEIENSLYRKLGNFRVENILCGKFSR